MLSLSLSSAEIVMDPSSLLLRDLEREVHRSKRVRYPQCLIAGHVYKLPVKYTNVWLMPDSRPCVYTACEIH